MAENNPENNVRDPQDHDVLLGRGGLINTHPGNNWYRRLVHSNRALYDQAKKHTKLLVSRAIVHHVQAQDPPGRFLEKDKSTGLWKEASYDKAVHKTSQALREKKLFKMNDANAQVGQTLLIPIAPADGGISSQQAATETTKAATAAQDNDLFDAKLCHKVATVTATAAAFAHENGEFDTHVSQQKATVSATAASVPQQNARLETNVSHRAAPVTTSAATLAQENAQFGTKVTALQHTASWFWSDSKKPQTASTLAGHIPPPTNQSYNLLRFFSNSTQGSAAKAIGHSSNINTTITNDAMIMHGGFDPSMEPSRFAPSDAGCLGSSQHMEPISLDNPIYQNMLDRDGSSSHSIEPLSSNNSSHKNKKRSRDTFESSSPPDAPS